MCDCIEKVAASLQEKCGDDEARMNGVSFCIDNNNQLQSFMTGSFSYRKRTKSGEFYKNKTTDHFVFSFCPFCGQKYNFTKDVKEK